MESNENAALIVPRGDPLKPNLRLQMVTVYDAEQRISEIAYVTPQKAPELLTVFNRAYLDLTKMLAWLEVEVGSAERHAKMRRSTLILDVAGTTLKAKGLKTSQDLREAVVDADTEYQNLCERQDAILAMRELLRGKLKSLEMAYTSVKKVLGDRPMLGANPYAGHNPSRAPDVEAGQNENSNIPRPQEQPRRTGGFVKAKYDFNS